MSDVVFLQNLLDLANLLSPSSLAFLTNTSSWPLPTHASTRAHAQLLLLSNSAFLGEKIALIPRSSHGYRSQRGSSDRFLFTSTEIGGVLLLTLLLAPSPLFSTVLSPMS